MGMSWKNRFVIGLTLFSMFFGVGNLIVPAFLGATAGEQVWMAFAGFAVTAVLLPVAGMAAVARCGSLERLTGRVHPVFALVFSVLTYLAAGPLLAIPRAAGMSFEMAMAPFLDSRLLDWFRPGYSLVFYGIAMLLAWKPERLSDKLGRITGPCVLTILTLFVIGVIFYGASSVSGEPYIFYGNDPLGTGLAKGSQTQDAMAALCFGIVLGMNICRKGVSDRRNLTRETILAACFTGLLLTAVYAVLTCAGAMEGSQNPEAADGIAILSGLFGRIFGVPGSALLAALFVLVCLNTCAGLLSCCSAYFHNLVPGVSYRRWILLFSAIGFLAVNTGLDRLPDLADPILGILYPPAIVLIVLSFLPGPCQRLKGLYPLTVGLTALLSLLGNMTLAGVWLPGISEGIARLPLYRQGYAWINGAVTGILLSLTFSLLPQKRGNPRKENVE